MSEVLRPIDLNLDSDLWTKTTKQTNDEDAGTGTKSEPVLSTPLENLTTVNLEGSGAFDVLMRATKLHLQEEFNAQRITGADYTQVYLGALTAVLQTSIQFLLNQQQAQQINAQIGLIRQQTVTELANTDDNLPVGLGFNFIPDEITPVPPMT